MRILSPLLVAVAVACAGGCAKRQLNKMNDQEDALAAQYDGASYDDMVQVGADDDHDDQGDSISPQALAAIQDAITNVYERDLGRCLQDDMDAYNNRWIGGTFTVEFKINTKGKVIAVDVLEEDIKEFKLPPGQKEPRKAKLFGPCIERAIYKWDFETPPEVEYVHTYTGQVGEAF